MHPVHFTYNSIEHFMFHFQGGLFSVNFFVACLLDAKPRFAIMKILLLMLSLVFLVPAIPFSSAFNGKYHY